MTILFEYCVGIIGIYVYGSQSVDRDSIENSHRLDIANIELQVEGGSGCVGGWWMAGRLFFFLPSCELQQCQPDFVWYFVEVCCFIQLNIHKS